MKNKVILLAVMLFITCQGFTQIYGLKFGWSQPDYTINVKYLNQDKDLLYQGYQFSFFIRTDSSTFFFQPEITYSKREGTFFNEPDKTGFNSAIDTFNQHIVLQTLSIPLSAGLNLINTKHFNVRGFGGVQATLVLDNKITTKHTFSPLTGELIENIVVKYFVGCGVDLLSLTFDARYYWDNTAPIGAADKVSFPFKKNYYVFSVGLKF